MRWIDDDDSTIFYHGRCLSVGATSVANTTGSIKRRSAGKGPEKMWVVGVQ